MNINAPPSLAFFGTVLSNRGRSEAVGEIFKLMQDYTKDLQPHYIAIVNVDVLCHAARDEELLGVLRNARLTLIDGMPIIWACCLMGDRKCRKKSLGSIFFQIL